MRRPGARAVNNEEILMRIGRHSAVAGLVLSGALLLSACGGGGSSSSSSGSSDSAKADTSAIITTNGSEPQNPLIPSNTTEVGGGKIVDLLFAGLVYYDAEGKDHNEVAESIESPDATTWTIKLKDGWTFTNGEKIPPTPSSRPGTGPRRSATSRVASTSSRTSRDSATTRIPSSPG